MRKKGTTIIQKASWKKAALFTMLFVAFYCLINFSGMGVAGLLKITGGANILDLELGYTYDEAYQILTALGTEGRIFYLTKIIPIDFVFPFIYMLFFTSWIALLIKHITDKKWCKYLLFVPVFAMLFDWIENMSIIVLLHSYPNLSAWAVFTASTVGILKMILSMGSIAIIGILIVIFIVKRIRK